MNVYVYDVTGERPWEIIVPNIKLLDNHSLNIPTKGDLLIIHSTDYNDSAQESYVEGNNSPYILWISTSPQNINKTKEHFYRYALPHKTVETHLFWNGLNTFIKFLKEKGVAKWDLLYGSINHLIALSILCQGFLAAHGEKGFKILDDQLQQKAEKNKGTTELRSWWDPALKDIINGTGIKDSEILAELEMTGRDYGIVKKLIESIRDYNNQYFVNGKLKTNKKQVERFTVLVNESYGTLTEILNG